MKKKILSVLLSIFSALFIWAMPGFNSFVPEIDGEYVYYQDYSFQRESYIGVLAYNKSTFQIRYYAPKNIQAGLPEKTVAIAVTINPESDFWDMTGEKILTTIQPNSEDLDILNYLHDILYDFSSIRKKVGEVSPLSEKYRKSNNFAESGISYDYDYPQFGGKVTVLFDPLIPIFNVKSIIGQDGSTLFQCATIGNLVSSDDSSFDNFKGMKSSVITGTGKKITPGKSKKFKTQDKQEITLDSNWEAPYEGAWVLGDTSFLTISSLPALLKDKTVNAYFTLRRILSSGSGQYTNFKNIEILYNEKLDQYKFTVYSYLPQSNNIIVNTRIFTGKKEGGFFDYSIATYYEDYVMNLNYFNAINKTYKAK